MAAPAGPEVPSPLAGKTAPGGAAAQPSGTVNVNWMPSSGDGNGVVAYVPAASGPSTSACGSGVGEGVAVGTVRSGPPTFAPRKSVRPTRATATTAADASAMRIAWFMGG